MLLVRHIGLFREAKSSCSCEISDQLGLPIIPQCCIYAFSFKRTPNMQLQNTSEGIILSQSCWEVLCSRSLISISSYSYKIWNTQFWELKPENGSSENKWMYLPEFWAKDITLVYTKEDQETNLCFIAHLIFFHFIQSEVSCDIISEFQNTLQISYVSVILPAVVEMLITLGKHLIIFLLPLYHYFSLPCPKMCEQFDIFCC